MHEYAIIQMHDEEVDILKVVSERLRGLRHEMHFSQTNLA